MNAKTIQKLKRELAKNKAKSAVLGVLCLVAAYYWLPLIGKFLPGKKEQTETTAATDEATAGPPVIPTANTNTVPTTDAPAATPELSWSKIARAIEADVYMTSMPSNPDIRSPFAFIEEPKAEQVATDLIPEEDGDVPTEEEEDESSIDIDVTSVIVGSRRSVATINGVAYKLGDTVRSADAEYQIVAIDADSISVTNRGETVQIPVSRPWAAPAGRSPSFR